MTAHVERMENWKDIAIGALIAQAIGSVWLYLRSIGDKVSKKHHEETMAALKTEHKEAIGALRAELDKTNAEIKGDFRRLETKIDAKLDNIQQQLLTLLARDASRSDR